MAQYLAVQLWDLNSYIPSLLPQLDIADITIFVYLIHTGTKKLLEVNESVIAISVCIVTAILAKWLVSVIVKVQVSCTTNDNQLSNTYLLALEKVDCA